LSVSGRSHADSLVCARYHGVGWVTQFYFRTNQKCKRYLKLAFKYLVLFRRRNVSLVPFGAILTLPPPPWEFATANSAEEGPALSTSSVVSHIGVSESHPDENPMKIR
jgi:hypothetical protein